MTLSQYRKSLGLTQKEMSEALGIHQASLARSEKAWPNVATSLLLALAKTYGAPIIIDFPGGVRFAQPGEIVTHESNQDNLMDDLNYLEDVEP